MAEDKSARPLFTDQYVNLASPQLGGAICHVSDEFFAPAKRMLSEETPVFIPDRFDQHGKWMDGWESRRKRTAGHDFCVLRICPGVIHGFEINTRHFTGNYPPAVMLEACNETLDPDCHPVFHVRGLIRFCRVGETGEDSPSAAHRRGGQEPGP